MELIKKLREANTMMWFGAKIDLSETINELEAHIIAQDNIVNGIQNLAQRRTGISQRKSFIKYLSLRHKCTRREIINMNAIQGRLDDPLSPSKEIDRLCNGIYLYPLRKRNKPNIAFDERKNLNIN